MRLLPKSNTPRWLVFMIDILISLFALAIAYILRFDFLSIPIDEELPALRRALPVFILVRAILFYVFKTHRGIVRHTSTQDAKRIFFAVTAGSVIFLILYPIRYHYIDGYYFLPLTIIVMEYLATMFFMTSTRFAVKLLYLESKKIEKDSTIKVVIYGAGESGLITKRAMEREGTVHYNIVAFVDDDEKLVKKNLEGIPIKHTSRLQQLLVKEDVDQLIIAIQKPDPQKKRLVIETALSRDVEVLNVPPVASWIGGELSSQQMKKVNIEDLLGRKPIRLQDNAVGQQLKNKTVLVTGAAGSIGSGLVRQIIRHEPKMLYLVDQAESDLYEIETELKRHPNAGKFKAIIVDVRNRQRLREVMEETKPDVIYHAAAYKHVPLMEENPIQAIETNVAGSRNMMDLAVEFGVEEFVMISTDKAVNPTNVMGATKRTAEMYAQAIREGVKTKFVTTRFGNVLGSNGSVIPLFKRQISEGGPVTVTDPEVTRYFMTIPEACQLVLEAGAMGEGGEIYIFDMGEPVKIDDLAHKMIKLSGYTPGKDIKIEYTGLRPGEKLYEELLNNKENTKETHHPQIMIADLDEISREDVVQLVDEIINSAVAGDIEKAIRSMKKLVPEYRSENSEFSKFDQQ